MQKSLETVVPGVLSILSEDKKDRIEIHTAEIVGKLS